MNEDQIKKITYEIIGSAFEVRKHLGRFLKEHTYEAALAQELRLRGLNVQRQVPVKITYKGIVIEEEKFIDILVENSIVLELKAISDMGNAEVSQLMTYMCFGSYNLGYLINFKSEDFTVGRYHGDGLLEKGIYRFVYSRELLE